MSWLRLAFASFWALLCTLFLLVNGHYLNGNSGWEYAVIVIFAAGEILIAAEFTFDWFGQRRQRTNDVEMQVNYVHLPNSNRPIVY